MLPRIVSARPAASPSTFASSVRARLFLLFIATSATSKPVPLLSLRTCPPRSPATTSSCQRPWFELARSKWNKKTRVAALRSVKGLDQPSCIFLVASSPFPNCSLFRQNTSSNFRGNNESIRRNCIHSLCGHLACSFGQSRRRRRAASLRLLRRVFPRRTPMGRKTARHSQPGQSPLLHAKTLGAPAPRWLSLRQRERRMDRRKIQGVRPRYAHRAV